MNFKNMTSSEITELVSSNKLNLSELSKEELEIIYDIEVAELYRDGNHSMKILDCCAKELSRYCMEDPVFAASAEKKITLEEISGIYEKRRSQASKEADIRKNNKNHLGKESYSIHKPRSVNRKWLLPILAMLSIIVITTVVTAAYGNSIRDVFVLLKEKIFYDEGNKSVIKTDTVRTYNSFDEFVNNEDVSNILLPYSISDEIVINTIKFSDYNMYSDILLMFDYQNNEQRINILTSYTPEYDFNEKTVLIGDFNVWWCEFDGMYQGDFIYNSNLYTVLCSSYEVLETIIINLEIK